MASERTPLEAATDAALVNGLEFLRTRFPQIPEPEARFIAKRMHAILFPYVNVAVHVMMADNLRTAGASVEVADALDAAASQFLDETLRESK
jgi:hypothetical protein